VGGGVGGGGGWGGGGGGVGGGWGGGGGGGCVWGSGGGGGGGGGWWGGVWGLGVVSIFIFFSRFPLAGAGPFCFFSAFFSFFQTEFILSFLGEPVPGSFLQVFLGEYFFSSFHEPPSLSGEPPASGPDHRGRLPP